MKNKKLGLIGGTGPESTLIYYKEINRQYMERVGKKEFPEFMITSIDVWNVLRLEEKEETREELIQFFIDKIQELQNANCTFASFSAVTPHLVFDEVNKRSPLPLVSVIETGCQEAKRLGLKKLALLGTKFTMNGGFVEKAFEKEGIEVITPDENIKEYIHHKLEDEIELGIVNQDTIEGMKKIAYDLIQQEQIDGIILGCTELPLVYQYIDLPITKLDMMEIHIHALVDELVKEQ